MKPYRVETVTDAREIEQLLNNAAAYGYRYKDAIPSIDPTGLGGSRTARFHIVLEHRSVALSDRAAPVPADPGAAVGATDDATARIRDLGPYEPRPHATRGR